MAQTTAASDEPSTDAHQTLLTEHFGFHPRVFVDALVYAANEHLYSIGSQFEEFAKKQLKAACRRAAKKEKEQAKARSGRDAGKGEGSSMLARMSSTQIEAEAERGVHGVLTLLENALDHIFDLLELYCLKAVFGVRASQATSMTLKHHRGLDLRTQAERATDREPLTAEDEYASLLERETELRERIERARRRRHALRIANAVADRSLARAKRVSEAFGVVIGEGAPDGARLSAITAQSARKLRMDAQSLVEALSKLAQTDPLGASLLNTGARSANDEERRAVMRASGVTEKQSRSWERGREAYVNWEMDRIIRNVRARAANETLIGDVTGMTSIALRGSPPGKGGGGPRPSLMGITIGAKRRRTTGRMSAAANPDKDEDHQAAQVGRLEDVERMASALSSSTAK